MKHLQIFNAVLLATGAALGLVLAVVCLIYSFYLDGEPRLQADMPALLSLTGGFTGLAVTAALAFRGHQQQWTWRWLAQASPLIPVLGITIYLANLRP